MNTLFSLLDLNIVKLIGTVTSDVNVTNGKVKFVLRTLDKDYYQYVKIHGFRKCLTLTNIHFICLYSEFHKIVVATSVMEKCPVSLQRNQKLFINGIIKPLEFIQDNGKKGTSLRVMAHQINQIDDGQLEKDYSSQVQKENIDYSNQVKDDTQFDVDNIKSTFEVIDQNRVILESFIWSQIKNEDDYSFFTLANGHSIKYEIRFHDKYICNDKIFILFYFRDDIGNTSDVFDLLPIFVYDDMTRITIKNHLQRLDRVHIEGVLKYLPCIDHIGNKQRRGAIEATRITKLTPFNQRK